MASYKVDIVTPIREVKLDNVGYLRCPGIDGSFGIMNDHREGFLHCQLVKLKSL